MAQRQTTDGAALIALDWGTSSCRAWLLGADGTPLDDRHSDAGTLAVSGRGDPRDPASRAQSFERAFLDMCGDWLAEHPGVPALASGMVGSNQGWREAEYLNLPADIESISKHLVRVPYAGGELTIVPGLFNPGDAATGAPPDVIRGEEVQILGALSGLPDDADPFLLMPGTHTKWVRCSGGTVTDFATAMTGELYGLVMDRSIVGRLAQPVADPDVAAQGFALGLSKSAEVGARGLAAAVFTGRTLVMGGHLDPTAVGDYVSGLLIGDEVAHMLSGFATRTSEVFICGNSNLARRYAQAVTSHGVRAVHTPEDIALAGLWSIANECGLVTAQPARGSAEVGA